MIEPVIVLRGTAADIEEVIREARAEFDQATLDVSARVHRFKRNHSNGARTDTWIGSR